VGALSSLAGEIHISVSENVMPKISVSDFSLDFSLAAPMRKNNGLAILLTTSYLLFH
jgi:hypothetical protein